MSSVTLVRIQRIFMRGYRYHV